MVVAVCFSISEMPPWAKEMVLTLTVSDAKQHGWDMLSQKLGPPTVHFMQTVYWQHLLQQKASVTRLTLGVCFLNNSPGLCQNSLLGHLISNFKNKSEGQSILNWGGRRGERKLSVLDSMAILFGVLCGHKDCSSGPNLGIPQWQVQREDFHFSLLLR
jgi:hypothetical protein